MMQKDKIKPIEAWAIVNKNNPKIIIGEIWEESRKKDFILDKDEEFIKVIIRKK